MWIRCPMAWHGNVVVSLSFVLAYHCTGTVGYTVIDRLPAGVSWVMGVLWVMGYEFVALDLKDEGWTFWPH